MKSFFFLHCRVKRRVRKGLWPQLNAGREVPVAEHRSGKQLTVTEIAEILGSRFIGNGTQRVDGTNVIERATHTQLAFVGDVKQLGRIANSRAQVILVPAGHEESLPNADGRTFLLIEDPEPAFLLIAGILNPDRPRKRIGISPHAIVDATAQIQGNTNIHPLAVIGSDVRIGHNCDIHSGVVIGDGCVIGDHVTIHPNTVLYHNIIVGNSVIIHASCVIGADGFGYRFVNGGHQKLPHYGTVRICDDVEIGAGTTIDRAKAGETVIGSGTRIDDQVMIGHNCQIGKHNLIVSQVGFAGSVTTGDYVVCAGQVGIADHVHLGTGAVIGAKAGVHRDMPGGQSYLGAPAAPVAETTKQLMALRRLPELRDTVRQMEKDLNKLRQQLSASRVTGFQDTADQDSRAA